MKQLKLIQVYRGIAAIMVVILHVSMGFNTYSSNEYKFMWYLFRPGWAGVDFFFYLSGFIIYMSSYNKFKTGYINVKSFMLSRVIRIYPLVWLVTTLFLMLYLIPGLYTGEPK